MPKTNDSTSDSQERINIKTSYTRTKIIKIFSELCLINSYPSNPEAPCISKPSLLISSSENDFDSANRFSFFCSNPTDSLAFYGLDHLQEWQSQLHLSNKQQNRQLNQGQQQDKEIPFHSGWLGYFSYPNTSNPIKISTKETPPATKQKAIAEFNYYPWVICFDHLNCTLHLLGTPTALAINLFKQLKIEDKASELPISNKNQEFATQGFQPIWSKNDYHRAFDKIKDYLKSGDCYQINLTQAYKAKYQGQASALLTPLFKQMQPNFGGYFKGLDVELISLSPERFISIDQQGRLEAKPIKGTIKRSSEADTDQDLINELSSSSKNKAENLMIVDLLRNDLSKSSLPGTVKVEKLFALESHPNVHHLVSTISAQLRPSINPAFAIAQAFPGGSITGAPKIRAMEIINELEAEPRSLYCGSLGYFSDSGNCDFNILIRNLEFRDGVITCWGGGGITIDSELDDEYEESITKIQRIMGIVEEQSLSEP